MTTLLLKIGLLAAAFAAWLFGRARLTRKVSDWGQQRAIPRARTAYILTTLNILLFIGFLTLALLIVGKGYADVGLFLSSLFAIIGIALFAQWSILSNITASVIIFFAFPYRIGDAIRIVDKDDDISGEILEITLFHVLIQRSRGDVVTYPNNLLLQKAVVVRPRTPAPERRFKRQTTGTQ